MKTAAVMLIIKNGLVLGISRKENPDLYGLVGGKVEDNEAPQAAAIRETLEETGIRVHTCIPIYEQLEPVQADGEEYYTYCFYATEWSGHARSIEGSNVNWLFAAELTLDPIEGGKSAFPVYNTNVMNSLKKLCPEVFVFSFKKENNYVY